METKKMTWHDSFIRIGLTLNFILPWAYLMSVAPANLTNPSFWFIALLYVWAIGSIIYIINK